MIQRILFVVLCFWSSVSRADSLEVQIGEKLFNEPRFSQFYFSQSPLDVNNSSVAGDPVLEWLQTSDGQRPHPFRGRQMSCASCHFVDHAVGSGLKVVTYNDFAARTPVTVRDDGQKVTTRNTSNFVGSVFKEGVPLHWDGEFFSAKELSCASLFGRNMGWKVGEEPSARAHIAHVIRADLGLQADQGNLSGSYTENLKSLGLNLNLMSDSEVLDQICGLIADYMESVDFMQDEGGYSGSAYDQFLKINGLPRKPSPSQSVEEYVTELTELLKGKTEFKWVEPQDLRFHDHQSQFKDLEFQGLQLFFGQGQCVACHTPPRFTDSLFHATGNNQLEYERLHGSRSFLRLHIPNLHERLEYPDTYLFATEEFPLRKGVLRMTPESGFPERADLGLWNVLFHPQKASIQHQLKEVVCRSLREDCAGISDNELLERSIGMFKTPTVRSLGQSAPYFSNGSAHSIPEVLETYMIVSEFSKRGRLRNASPFLKKMQIRPHHFHALQAFLEALDEDYE